MIKKIFAIFTPEDRTKIYVLIIFLCVAAIFEVFGMFWIMSFVSIIQSPDIIENNRWPKLAYDLLHASSYNNFVILVGLLILTFYMLKNISVSCIIYWQSNFLARAESELATNLLSNYLSMPYENYLQRNNAELVNNATMGTSMLFAGLLTPCFILISDALIVAAILALLIYVAPVAMLATIVTIGICATFFYVMLRGRFKNLGKLVQYHREEMFQLVKKSLSSMKEMTVLQRKEFFVSRVCKHSHEIRDQQACYEAVKQLPRLILESFGMILLVITSIILIKQKIDLLPNIFLFVIAAFRLIPAINRIISSATKVRYYNHTLDVLYKELSQENSGFRIQEGSEQVSGLSSHKPFINEILIKDISYAYTGSETQVLANMNLVIKKGSSVGIIGASGSGKSTLVDILLGLLVPQNGQVLVDGVDIRHNLAEWRRHISYIPQIVCILDDTIKRNIALSIPDEQIDEILVWDSLRKAQADVFIREMEGGLETVVGENGFRLSSDQRQRIGIARALYNKPDILILDESTTELDAETEAQICETFKEIAQDATVFAISCQPALIEIVDRIYKIEGGKLVAR